MDNSSKGKVVLRVLAYVKPYKGLTIVAFVMALINVTLTLLIPIIIGRAIDVIVGVGDVNFQVMTYYLVALLVTVAISSFCYWALCIATNKISYNVIKDMREDAFKHLNTLPLKYIDTNAHGNVMNRIVTDADLINDGMIHGFTQLFTGVLTIVMTIGFMFAINYIIAIVVIALTPLSLVLAAVIAKKSNKLFRKQLDERGEMSGLTEELVGGIKIVKAFGYEDVAEKRFEDINQKLYISGVRSQFISAIGNPSTRFVNALIYAAVGIAGALCVTGVVTLPLTVGELVSLLAYANQYTKPFNEISGVVSELQTARAAAQRMFALLESESERSDEGLPRLENVAGNIKFDNVSFGYDEDKPLIRNLNLDISAGKRIAIVGATGCGKTTLINLLMRFYDINEGVITLDGVDIKSVTRGSLRSKYGMVLQDTWLFGGTLRENIAYGNSDASEEEVEAAAKRAFVHGFVSQLKDGYDTIIDESIKLSEGQKQLICIARIMLTNPPMLILDEATSNIDTLTEVKIQQAFDDLMQGKTSFVVAHRLSTIRNADTILFMEKGNVVESGNHEELLALGGKYCELYRSQFVKA